MPVMFHIFIDISWFPGCSIHVLRSNFIHTFSSVTDVELTVKGLVVTAVVWRESEGNICHLMYAIWTVVTENDLQYGLHP
jgi:hypothetical protein